MGAGDYHRWFAEALSGLGCRLILTEPHLGQALPAKTRAFDAILVTGSPLSLTRPEPWMARLAEGLRRAVEQRVPTLGVCFGHQLLAQAYGARIVRNPRGREVGTIFVRLSPAGRSDPLFEGIPGAFQVQATHQDILDALPAGATLLASNDSSAVQAMALGSCCRTVQFHPELTPAGMKLLLQSRMQLLEREALMRGEPPGERVRGLLASVGHTPYGKRLLHNFFTHYVM